MRRYLETDDLVGTAEIAQLAGVSSAAVSNWSNRDPSFPKPLVRLGCGPIFEWKEVERWLVATKRLTIKGALW